MQISLDYPTADFADIPKINQQLRENGLIVKRWFAKTKHVDLSPFPCVVIEADNEAILNYLFETWKMSPEVHERRKTPRKEIE